MSLTFFPHSVPASFAVDAHAGKNPGNQPARLAQFDDGNDCAILVQGDEGPAQVVQLGHRGTPSVICQRRWCHLLAACPIPSLRWRGESAANSSLKMPNSLASWEYTGNFIDFGPRRRL